MSKNCLKLTIFFKKGIQIVPFFQNIANGIFLVKRTIFGNLKKVFGNFLTVKWQFSGGSAFNCIYRDHILYKRKYILVFYDYIHVTYISFLFFVKKKQDIMVNKRLIKYNIHVITSTILCMNNAIMIIMVQLIKLTAIYQLPNNVCYS